MMRQDRILVVEDDSTRRDILSRLLSSEGYDVVAASNGKVISMSGYLDDAMHALTRIDRKEPLLAKPFSLKELVRVIRTTFE